MAEDTDWRYTNYLRVALDQHDVRLTEADLADLSAVTFERAEFNVGEVLLDRLTVEQQLEITRMIDEGHPDAAKQAMNEAVDDLIDIVTEQLWLTAVDVAASLAAELSARAR